MRHEELKIELNGVSKERPMFNSGRKQTDYHDDDYDDVS